MAEERKTRSSKPTLETESELKVTISDPLDWGRFVQMYLQNEEVRKKEFSNFMNKMDKAREEDRKAREERENNSWLWDRHMEENEQIRKEDRENRSHAYNETAEHENHVQKVVENLKYFERLNTEKINEDKVLSKEEILINENRRHEEAKILENKRHQEMMANFKVKQNERQVEIELFSSKLSVESVKYRNQLKLEEEEYREKLRLETREYAKEKFLHVINMREIWGFETESFKKLEIFSDVKNIKETKEKDSKCSQDQQADKKEFTALVSQDQQSWKESKTVFRGVQESFDNFKVETIYSVKHLTNEKLNLLTQMGRISVQYFNRFIIRPAKKWSLSQGSLPNSDNNLIYYDMDKKFASYKINEKSDDRIVRWYHPRTF